MTCSTGPSTAWTTSTARSPSGPSTSTSTTPSSGGSRPATSSSPDLRAEAPMVSPATKVTGWVTAARRSSPLLDHGVRTQQHYADVNGTALAGGVTYYGFLSFFPLLAVAFFVVGQVAKVYPQARD